MFRPFVRIAVTPQRETRLVVVFPATLRALSREHQRQEVERALVEAQERITDVLDRDLDVIIQSA